MGMSALPMTLPEAAEGELTRLELMISLPPDWSKPQPGPAAVRFADDEFVPVGAMKRSALYVHEQATWFRHGHTIQWNFPDGHALSAFKGFLLAATPKWPKLAVHTRPDGEAVGVLALIPLYAEEMAFKLEHGADALFKLADRAGLTDLIEPGRASLLKQQRFWDRFS
jgi:Suppressor of fused protein (SUFU)